MSVEISRGEPPRRASALNLEAAYRAARMYYLEDATQAQIAARLNVSRPTVSRLIAEARRAGLVRIEVVPPNATESSELADRLAESLGLQGVRLAPRIRAGHAGHDLRPAVAAVLEELAMAPGEVLLVASGETTYEVSQGPLPPLPGVLLAPTVGGVSEPEAHFQTNEITRAIAQRTGAIPRLLFAPAVPSPALYRTLLEDPDFRATTALWDRARVALVGVGAAPLARGSISAHVPLGSASIRSAAGDVCLNFVDHEGAPVEFEGSDRMIRISPEQLRRIDACIAIAAGENKVRSIRACARAGLFNRLITDVPTAEALLAAR
ncbi:DNA-binding transcriptional regulator LsrR (DeoR family) [Propionibacteriaceae bacterium ES.041]|uniref:DNA-binding transcriptional regulator n=1 Tax=Enemella evansiae TaxID=2016499 RepID=A0A255GIN4_9ACTN|nr:sugar-binding domain-containing protein [Enemella evansiae]PFG65439.1 DNA-binding transcriptional regulator LsrR (DeoR family) [Propionibacteriaceae bacterium ES.041]OYN96218.1 DNA-binding transcriptional regulator [Enemella evansiae]OYO06837.1 DNA-binding transcriptional regulator [Enemella evansiae]OYO12844.1 DNA-binding transcriptional regulator [Enemella evansiae]OYO19213.1 DNA-binding transcriptional regulator [Enemella evansiae]